MFEIVVDSAANIPAELVKKYNIRVISFVNYVNDEPLVCFDPELSPEQERKKGKDYYDSMRNGIEVKTGLVSTGEFENLFREITDAGSDILYFSLSKNISGTYNSARIAAEAVLKDCGDSRKIRLIDALNASLGQGILAIYASEMREIGMDIDKAAELLESYVPRMNGVFTVGDLKYISKTGRISGTKAVVGSILNIKPILVGNKDGYIVQFKKCRGRKAALNTLIDLMCDNIVEPENQIVGIAHADAYEESLYIMEEVQKRITVKEFINTTYDFCTGSHVGPDTIAIFFMAKDRELENN
ncbi:MAG: DegV family protein [Firmicutes bacterium]|jgi:DegV family protein with EDD domain|nr:DegV family protein [Bacillota bacterium]